MHAISRQIPPTPVAAPSNGTTWLGWLCDSCAKQCRRFLPFCEVWKRTIPASSPGPMSTCVPSVGSNERYFREDLYWTMFTPWIPHTVASVSVGLRPSILQFADLHRCERYWMFRKRRVISHRFSDLFQEWVPREIGEKAKEYARTKTSPKILRGFDSLLEIPNKSWDGKGLRHCCFYDFTKYFWVSYSEIGKHFPIDNNFLSVVPNIKREYETSCERSAALIRKIHNCRNSRFLTTVFIRMLTCFHYGIFAKRYKFFAPIDILSQALGFFMPTFSGNTIGNSHTIMTLERNKFFHTTGISFHSTSKALKPLLLTLTFEAKGDCVLVSLPQEIHFQFVEDVSLPHFWYWALPTLPRFTAIRRKIKWVSYSVSSSEEEGSLGFFSGEAPW